MASFRNLIKPLLLFGGGNKWLINSNEKRFQGSVPFLTPRHQEIRNFNEIKKNKRYSNVSLLPWIVVWYVYVFMCVCGCVHTCVGPIETVLIYTEDNRIRVCYMTLFNSSCVLCDVSSSIAGILMRDDYGIFLRLTVACFFHDDLLSEIKKERGMINCLALVFPSILISISVPVKNEWVFFLLYTCRYCWYSLYSIYSRYHYINTIYVPMGINSNEPSVQFFMQWWFSWNYELHLIFHCESVWRVTDPSTNINIPYGSSSWSRGYSFDV